jgi:hypothetical protein
MRPRADAGPDRDDKSRIVDGQRARKVHGVRTAKRVVPSELTRAPLHGRRQLDGTRSRPEVLPCLFRGAQVVVPEIVVAGGRGERGADLRVREPARQSRVAAVPQLGGELAPCLLYGESYQGA